MKNELKIRDTETLTDYQEQNVNLFSQTWNKATFSIGIREPLESDELQVIYEFVHEEYKSLSLKDIDKAFRLYASQKLDFKDSHYQSFDNVFIGKVLISYQEWLRKDNLKPKVYIEPSHQIGNKLDPIAEREKAFKFIDKVWSDKKSFPIIANWSDAFLYAEESNLISLSNDEKIKIKEEVELDIKKDYLDQKSLKGLVESFNLFLEKASLKTECRKKTLQKYFINK